METHHVFEGNPNRNISEKYGLKVHICGIRCHREGEYSAHKNKEVRKRLEKEAQREFERVHGTREDFIRIFGKNYL